MKYSFSQVQIGLLYTSAFFLSLLMIAPVTTSAYTIPTPTVSNEQLRTPGLGFQESIGRIPSAAKLAACNYDTSLDSANDNDIKAGTVYVRMMWQEFEPAEGQYAWDKLDAIFACAHQKGQSVDLRVMLTYPANDDCTYPENSDVPNCISHKSLPDWLINDVNTHTTSVFDTENYELPDWDDALLWSKHEALIQALGTRYDGHPDLNSVDIGSVGLWGEWHIFGASQFLPTIAQRKGIIDIYKAAFPTTPLIALAEIFETPEMATYVINNGNHPSVGWRGDSWGVVGHHRDDYEANINAVYPDIWKTGNVTMETTDVLSGWASRINATDDYERTLPIDDAIADALSWKTSAVHNKANPIPEAYKPAIREMAKKLGFRLILREASYTNTVNAGTSVTVNMNWENVGVAPPYRDFRLAFRLRNSNGDIQTENITSQTVKGWLPGSVLNKSPSFTVPANLAAGNYSIETGIVFHNAIDRILPIAITGRTQDNWYPLGNITINNDVGNPDQIATIASITVPVNESTKSNINDNDLTSSWENDGNAATAHFSVTLDKPYQITRIRYKDINDRQIIVRINGVIVFNGWISTVGYTQGGYAEITLPTPVLGNVISIEAVADNWLVIQDLEIYYTGTTGTTYNIMPIIYSLLLD